MLKRFYAVLLLTILTGAAMFFLVSSSRKPIETKHGFNRKFNNNKVNLIRSAIVPHTLFVAGNTDSVIYFHSDQPQFITYADTGLNNLGTIRVPVDSLRNQLAGGFSIYVGYPDAFLYANNIASIIKYNIPEQKLTFINTPSNYTNAIQVNDSVFMLKCFTGHGIDQTFCQLNIYTQRYKTESLPVATDLSARGTLLYDSLRTRCLYVHQFSNKISIFDTALHLLSPAHTIDTFTQDHGQYISHKKTGSDDVLYKPKGDRMLINYLSQVDEGKLYVNSLLKADNETLMADQRETVIDVYDTHNNTYIESFYVPLGNSRQMASFKVLGKRMVVTYADRISIYEIP